jgi:hypothetical protein
MNETQRAAAIRLSSLIPGGDGSTIVLDLGYGALLDFMGNPSPFQSNNAPTAMFQVEERADLTPPVLLKSSFNYGTGLLTIAADEFLDGTTLTADTCVNGSSLTILSLNSSLAFVPARLTGSQIEANYRKDGFTLVIRIPEATRLAVQQQQNLLMGSSLTLAAFEGAIFDLSRNPNVENLTLSLPTIPDTLPPVVTLVELDYGTGHLTVTTDESLMIGITSGEGLFAYRIRLSNQTVNVTGGFHPQNNSVDEIIDVANAQFLGKVGGTKSSVKFEMYLGEIARTRALRMSGTSGGDGSAMFISFEAEAFKDMVGNNNTAQVLTIQEVADTIRPVFLSAAVNYSTGILNIVSNEILDLSSIRFGSLGPQTFFNLTNLVLTDLQGDLSSTIAVLEGAIATHVLEDGYVISIKMIEAHRAAAVVSSGIVDGDNIYISILQGFARDYAGNLNSDNPALQVAEILDTVPPTVTGASLDLGTGIFTLFASETMALKVQSGAFFNLSILSLFNYNATEPFLLQSSNHTIESATIYFLQRDAFSGTESDDFPDANGENYNWTTGNHLQNTIDATSVTFQLPEPARIAALRMSGTPGGDGFPLSFAAGQHAFVDLMGNPSIATDGPAHVTVVETEDTVRPTVTESTGGGLHGVPGLNYNTGEFAVKFSEIIDGTPPASHINLNKIVVTDRFNENNVSLSGSEFIYDRDRETIYVTVGTIALQNIISIADDAEAVEQAIDIPVKVHFGHGAVLDLAGNPNVAIGELRLQDRNNSRGVPKIKSMSFATLETGFKREMKFFGSKRLPGDAAKFVGYNSTDCNSPVVGGIATPDEPGITSNGVVTLPYGGVNVTFSETSPPNYPYRVCYYFLADTEGKGFQLVPDVYLTVVSLDTVSVSVGQNNQSVIGQHKFFTFGGVGVSPGDSVKWVPGGGHPEDACDIQTATTVIGDTVTNNVVTVANPGLTYDGTNGNFISFQDRLPDGALPYELCYAFTSKNLQNALPEPFKLHSEFKMFASEIVGIGATAGDNFTSVVQQSKNFAFVGSGVTNADKVRYISGSNASAIDANCIFDPQAGGLVGGNVQNNVLSVTGPSGNFANEITFMVRSNPTKPIKLCYKFGEEPYRLYPLFTIENRQVIRVQTIVGAPDVAVVGAPKTYYFVGTGQQALVDVVKIVGATATENSDCANYGIAVTTDGSSGGPITSAVTSSSVGVDGNLEVSAAITLTFLTESPFDPWRLCYKFHNEPFKLYTGLTFSARRVTYITASSGSSTLFVANHRVGKEWSVYGYGLREGDKLKWVPDTVTTDAECGQNSDNAQAIAGTGVVDNQLTVRTFATLGLVNSVPVELIISSATTHGGPLVMCYQFASEPYKLYPSIQVKVAILTNLTVNVGSPSQIVVGATKIITLSGVGLNTGDQFKYVPGIIATDAGCGQGSDNAHDGFVGTFNSNSGTEISFDTSSKDGELKLCYKFGTEVYKLYEDFTLSVASIDRIDSSIGDSGVAVVGVSKTLTFVGTAISQNPSIPDTFKYIRMPTHLSKTSNSDLLTNVCSEYPSYTQNKGGETVTTGKLALVLFQEMSPAGNPYILCYRFGTEPYRALTEFNIVVKKLEGVLNAQPAIVIVGAFQNLTFLGTHVSDFVFGLGGKGAGVADEAKWVETFSGEHALSSEYCAQALPSHGSEVSSIDRRPCASTYECNLIPRGIGLFYFNRSTKIQNKTSGVHEQQPLQLCYRFGTEAWQLIPLSFAKLNVYPGEILDSSTHTAVVGRTKIIAFAGTTGVATGGDAAKWVLFGSKDCTAAGRNIDTILSPSPKTALAPAPLGSYYGVPTSGIFLFDKYPPNGQPYILCYRFGGAVSANGKANPFVLFPAVRLHVKALEAVVLPFGFNTEITSGDKVTFRFDGRGVANGDQVLWFSKRSASKITASSEFSDLTCDKMAPVSDAIGLRKTLRDAHASFKFPVPDQNVPSTSDEYILCYKFTGEDYKLYSNLPILDEKEAALLASEARFKNTRVRIKVSLTTLRNDPTTDLDYYPIGSNARIEFIDKFCSDIARALGIQKSRVRVLSLSRGSIIVDFVIDPVQSDDSGGLLSEQAAALLEQQVKNKDPLLLTGDITQKIDTSPAAQPNPSVGVVTDTTGSGSASSTTSGSSTTSSATQSDSGSHTYFVQEINGTNVSMYTELGRAGAQPSFTSLAVIPQQDGGLFAFTHREYNVVEDIGKATVEIERLGGSAGSVVIKYSTVDPPDSAAGTATPNVDYAPVSGVIVFKNGVTKHSFTVPIMRDSILENHFETIKIRLNPLQSGIPGQSLSAATSRYSQAQIKIFDAYNPNTVTSDNLGSGTLTTMADPRALVADSFGLDSGSTNSTMGWRIVGNGDESLPHMNEALTGIKEIDVPSGSAALVATQELSENNVSFTLNSVFASLSVSSSSLLLLLPFVIQ